MKKIIVSLCAVAAIAFTSSAFASDAPSTDGLPAASLAANANWSTITFDPVVADTSVATLVLNVTDDATLTFDETVALSNLYFNISSGKTLTIATNSTGVVTLTGSMIAFGGGTIAADFLPLSGKLELVNTPFVLNNPCEIRAIQVQENGSMKFAEGASFTLYENMTFADSTTLAVGNKTDFLDFGGSQTVITSEETLPAASCFTCSGTGVGYSVARTATTISLSCAAVADAASSAYAATSTTTPSGKGFLASLSTVDVGNSYSVAAGPGGTYQNGYLFSSAGPWSALAAHTSAFSFSVYADVSWMSSSGKNIIVSYGSNYGTAIALDLYREGSYVKLAFVQPNGTVSGTAASVDISSLSAGFHLWTAVCDPSTGDLALYLDDGTTKSEITGTGPVALAAGFQLAGTYQAKGTGFSDGAGLVIAGVATYDGAISVSKVSAVSSLYPVSAPLAAWANTKTSCNVSGANGAFWKLRIPATAALPSNSVVLIKSISLGSRQSTYTPDVHQGDACSVTVVDMGGATIRSDVISGYDSTPIAANASTSVGRLKYVFSSALKVRVGVTYDMTLCHSNGKALYWSSSGAAAGAKMVTTSDASSVLSMSDSLAGGGHYPVYEIDGEVVSLPTATSISANSATSGLVWSPVPLVGGTQFATINATGSATLTIDAAISTDAVAINVGDSVALTLAGANAITATSIAINGDGSVSTAVATALSGALTGDGEVVYSGVTPSGITIGSAWIGTVAVENLSSQWTDINPSTYGNAKSKFRLKGVTGYFTNPANQSTMFAPEVVFENGTGGFAFKPTNGYSYDQDSHKANVNEFSKISGSGTFAQDSDKGYSQLYLIRDGSGFTGSFDQKHTSKDTIFVFATAEEMPKTDLTSSYMGNTYKWGSINVMTNATMTIGDGSSWVPGPGGIRIFGTVTMTGAASMNGGTAGVTFSDGATLVFNGLTAEKKLTLSAAPTFASGTVNVTLGAGVTPAEGMTLISWPEGSVPAGTFKLTNESTLALKSTATGVVFAKKEKPVIFLVR